MGKQQFVSGQYIRYTSKYTGSIKYGKVSRYYYQIDLVDIEMLNGLIAGIYPDFFDIEILDIDETQYKLLTS